MKRSTNFKGPWDVPPRRQHFDNHYFVQITIYDPEKDENEDKVSEHIIDYGEYEDRKFLGRITHWAMENNYIVETMRVIKG